MKSSANNPQSVLLLDFWSDKNRGDAAMQLALIGMIRQYLPNARLVMMSAYGWNQFPGLVGELDETRELVDEVVGGVRATHFPLAGTGIKSGPRRKMVTAVSSLVFALLRPTLGLLHSSGAPLPRELRRSLDQISQADLIIWNGRNFRCDSQLREYYEIWQLLYNPRVCLSFERPVAAVGVSIWPLSSFVARRVGAVLDRTVFTSFRERESYMRGVTLMTDSSKGFRLPDLSLRVLGNQVCSGNSDQITGRPVRPRKVALTVVDWTNDGTHARDNYVEALKGMCGHLIRNGTESVVLIPQVTFEMESTSAIAKDLVNCFPDYVTIASGRPTVEALADSYAEFDLLVATRMHSAIFASSRGVPVMTIPYDAGGKWGILEDLGLFDIAVPYNDASADRLIEKVEEVWRRREELRSAVAERLPSLIAEVDDNIKIPISGLRML